MLPAEVQNTAEKWEITGTHGPEETGTGDPHSTPGPVRPRSRPRPDRKARTQSILTRRVQGREFLRYVLLFAVCALMALTVTVRYAALAEAGYRLNATQERLAEAETEHQNLVALRDELMDPARIEAVAIESLGMTNSESYRPVTVAVERRDIKAPAALVASATVSLESQGNGTAGQAVEPGDPVLNHLTRGIYAWFVGPRAAQAQSIR